MFYKMFQVLSFVACFSFSAQAYVVQEQKNAFSYKNMARDFGGSYNQTFKYKAEAENEDQEVDYVKIADKMLVSPEPFPNINLKDMAIVKIKMKQGQSVKIELPETEGTIWKYDVSDEVLTEVSSVKENGLRILELKAMKSGAYKVFLDNYTEENGVKKVLESKILHFNVKDK